MKPGQNIKYAPYAFTEYGAVMLAAVLNSPVAITAGIQVVRAFVRLRALVATVDEMRQLIDRADDDTAQKALERFTMATGWRSR